MAEKIQIISGALASSLTSLFIQPFDVVKTAYLTGQKSGTVLEAAQLVYGRHGLSGYWRGSKPAASRALISGGAGFPMIELLNSVLPGGFASNLVSSALSRGLVICLVSPLTVLKVRMEAPQATSYQSLGDGCIRIYKEVGVRGYYVGVGPNLVRDIPYAGFAYAFYKYYFNLLGGNEHLTFFAAAAGSCTASLLTQPFDVLKTRMQFAHIDLEQRHPYHGAIDGFQRIWNSEGLRGFTRGLTIRLTEKSMSYAVLWGVYEKIKDVMRPS